MTSLYSSVQSLLHLSSTVPSTDACYCNQISAPYFADIFHLLWYGKSSSVHSLFQQVPCPRFTYFPLTPTSTHLLQIYLGSFVCFWFFVGFLPIVQRRCRHGRPSINTCHWVDWKSSGKAEQVKEGIAGIKRYIKHKLKWCFRVGWSSTKHRTRISDIKHNNVKFTEQFGLYVLTVRTC